MSLPCIFNISFILKSSLFPHSFYDHIDGITYRPYALTSCLHNNDAMLGVKTCRAARTCCAGRVHWRSASQSVRGPGPAPAVWHAGVGPLAACLAIAHVAVPRLTPNARGRPSVTSYAYAELPTVTKKNRICYEIWKGIRKYESASKKYDFGVIRNRMLPPFISAVKANTRHLF